MGNLLTFKSLETSIVLLMGILSVPFQTLYQATLVILEDQGLHEIVLERESYNLESTASVPCGTHLALLED